MSASLPENPPVLSFVIPAYNERDQLQLTLPALHEAAKQLGHPYELIVVDDHSDDDTAEIAQQLGARVIGVQCRQISATRNAGAKAAHGKVLIFVDADTRVSPDAVRAAWVVLGEGAIGGGADLRFEADQDLEWSLRVTMACWRVLSRTCRWAAGCFIFVRRDAFERVGGFDERYFASEEILLSRVLKREGRFVILREAVFTSPRKMVPRRMRQYLLIFLVTLATGGRNLTRRDGLDPWYDGNREN